MKYNVSRKVIAFVLSILMLFSCTVYIFAVNNYGSFSGEIVAQSYIDLSNIEIQVYSAVPVYDTSSTDELIYYEETYEYGLL